MMRICRVLILFCLFMLVSPPCRGDTSGLREYIIARNGSEDILAQVLNVNVPYKGCAQTVTNLICIHSGIYPNIANNPIAKTGVLKNLLVSATHLLYLKVLDKYPYSTFIDYDVQKDVFLRAQRNKVDSLVLKGIESATFNQKDWCAAVASIRIAIASNEINNIFGKQEFIKEYCKDSLSTAKKLISESKYEEALSILNELHILQPYNVDIYMNTAEVLYKVKRLDESEKIAIDILSDYSKEMTESQLIKLNELFDNLEVFRHAQ